MGMFDEVTISIDLLKALCPDNLPEFLKNEREHTFQTKDFDCILQRYVISDDFRLMSTSYNTDENVYTDSNFHGIFTMHSGNVSASGPFFGEQRSYTEGGANAEFVTYSVLFSYGLLRSITQVGYTCDKSYDRKCLAEDWKAEDARRNKVIELRAYQNYLERINKNGVGDQLSDWVSAEKSIRLEEIDSWSKRN